LKRTIPPKAADAKENNVDTKEKLLRRYQAARLILSEPPVAMQPLNSTRRARGAPPLIEDGHPQHRLRQQRSTYREARRPFHELSHS
jgi:hypothetical protein